MMEKRRMVIVDMCMNFLFAGYNKISYLITKFRINNLQSSFDIHLSVDH